MKNQNFGENRDLLKFDLVQQVLASGIVDRLVYVPMLTEDEPSHEAEHICRHESTGGGKNTELINFLDLCVVNDRRQVSQLADYFQQAGYAAEVYAADKYLTRENRRAYFETLAAELKPRTLLLIDPDVGLEEDDNDPGRLLFSEIRDLYNVMDEESIIMITQRFPYDMYEEYLAMRTHELKDQLPFSQPVSIDDLDSIIFFLPMNQLTLNRVVQILREYAQKYLQTVERPAAEEPEETAEASEAEDDSCCHGCGSDCQE